MSQAQQPTPHRPGPPPAYPPYPPPYGYHPYQGGFYPPYGYYPWYPQPVVTPPTPVERPVRPGRARIANVVLALVAMLATIGALALAAAAPTFATHPPTLSSSDYHLVYAGRLTDDASHWDVSQGCAFEQGGLHAAGGSADAVCTFRPSADGDLTSRGFSLTAQVGPARGVARAQEPFIALSGDAITYVLLLDQQGNYVFESAADGDTDFRSVARGGTVAWHADDYELNTVSVQYAADAQQVTVYVNDQRVLTSLVSISGQFKLELGAPKQAEAVFTRFSLSSRSAG